MGCSSSVQTKNPTENGKVKEKQKVEEVAASQKTGIIETVEATMTTVEINGAKQLENDTILAVKQRQEPELDLQNQTADIKAIKKDLNLQIVEDLVKDEDGNEETDGFDFSVVPTTHKKEHATQNTLDFVYHHSSSSSPAQNPGNFPVSPTGVVPNSFRSLATQRRPSGVPPPPRELKPGDYLYQRNLSNTHEMSEGSEDEEEDT